ncbi:MAG: hypothetical protein SCJ94_06285 [Bacillota bacterium]|nr:hypothetical protein [Bacillota bacterium]
MIIDWYTIIFQIINFLILVFLLRHFFYGPIIKMMDDRERKIVEREEEAEASRRKAEQETEAYRQKNEELEQKQEELLDKAHSDAEEEKSELLNNARSEVDQTRRRWEEALEREKEAFIIELRRRIGLQACLLARHCLDDLADARLEELIWNQFMAKIGELSDHDRSELEKGFKANDFRLNLSSAFDAGEDKIKDLKKKLKVIYSDSEAELELEYKKDSALICGLELEAGGYRVSWNIDSYLEGIEADILKELNQVGPVEDNGEVPAGDQSENS